MTTATVTSRTETITVHVTLDPLNGPRVPSSEWDSTTAGVTGRTETVTVKVTLDLHDAPRVPSSDWTPTAATVTATNGPREPSVVVRLHGRNQHREFSGTWALPCPTSSRDVEYYSPDYGLITDLPEALLDAIEQATRSRFADYATS